MPNISKRFDEQGFKHITTRTHAAQAARQIRTFKDMLEKMMEDNKHSKPNITNIKPQPQKLCIRFYTTRRK